MAKSGKPKSNGILNGGVGGKIWNSVYFRLVAITISFLPIIAIFGIIMRNFEDGQLGQLIAFVLAVFLLGVVVVSLAVWSLPPNAKNKIDKPYFYSLIILYFGGFADLNIFLEYEGFGGGNIGEYLKKGEPYLDSPYGSVICAIDGFIFFPMYIFFISQATKGESYRKIGLYWFGAIFNSMVVLVTSAAHHGPTFCSLLNTFWVFFPIILFMKCWEETPKYKVNVINTKSIWRRWMDLSFVIFLIIYIVLSTVRQCASTGSLAKLSHAYRNFDKTLNLTEPAPFVQIQMAENFFYGIPICTLLIWGLISKGFRRLADISLVFAGAAMQGQITHMYIQGHSMTSNQMRVDFFKSDLTAVYHWIIGLGLLIIPHILALRFHWVKKNTK